MSGKRLYKTKLCVLYERGRCWRHTCSFAHGEPELRPNPASFDDRRDGKVSESRDRIDRRHSMQHRYSPEETTETRPAIHGHSPLLSFRRRRKNKHVDGQSNFSGSARVSDGAEVHDKDGKLLFSDSRDIVRKQLKQVKFDIDLLVDDKSKLEAELEERAQEADSLSSRIQDLEAQLSEEKERCVMITSKIKKFLKAQSNCVQLHHELKRSQVRLDKVVEELDLDALQLHTNEDDSSINFASDGETADHMVNYALEKRKDITSFATKKLHINIEAEEGSRSGSLLKRGQLRGEKSFPQRRVDHILANGRKESEVGNKRKDAERLQSNEGKPKRKRDGPKWLATSGKVKGFENHQLVPATSMAAHAMDEFEVEERVEMVESAIVEKEAARVTVGFPIPLPPLPSYSQNNYSQYEGDDEDVIVDELEEDLVEVDII